MCTLEQYILHFATNKWKDNHFTWFKKKKFSLSLGIVSIFSVTFTRSKHMKGSKEHYLLGQKPNAKFQGNPLCQTTKQHNS